VEYPRNKLRVTLGSHRRGMGSWADGPPCTGVPRRRELPLIRNGATAEPREALLQPVGFGTVWPWRSSCRPVRGRPVWLPARQFQCAGTKRRRKAGAGQTPPPRKARLATRQPRLVIVWRVSEVLTFWPNVRQLKMVGTRRAARAPVESRRLPGGCCPSSRAPMVQL